MKSESKRDFWFSIHSELLNISWWTPLFPYKEKSFGIFVFFFWVILLDFILHANSVFTVQWIFVGKKKRQKMAEINHIWFSLPLMKSTEWDLLYVWKFSYKALPLQINNFGGKSPRVVTHLFSLWWLPPGTTQVKSCIWTVLAPVCTMHHRKKSVSNSLSPEVE